MIITGLQACTPNGATVVTLGTFDGVHRGHQALFERVKATARQRGAKSLVLTFPQPPQDYLNGKPKKPLILPLAKKLELIEGYGIDTVVLVEFEEIASMSPLEFSRQVLRDRLRATEVVVGYDCQRRFHSLSLSDTPKPEGPRRHATTLSSDMTRSCCSAICSARRDPSAASTTAVRW